MDFKFILVVLVVLSSCAPIHYLPEASQLDVNPYGSYIKLVKRNTRKSVKGELISVDKVNLIVLKKDFECEEIPIDNVFEFRLRYARGKHYGWTIPLFSALSFTHGFYLIFTTPLNLITTIAVSSGGAKAFQYSERDITYDDLGMFARFPQGLPEGVDMKKLKNSKRSYRH